jgi:hypothetical protein
MITSVGRIDGFFVMKTTADEEAGRVISEREGSTRAVRRNSRGQSVF